MRVLAIETATEAGSVAVVVDGVTLAEITARVPSKHAETLLPNIHRALELASLRAIDVELIAVGVGPGSFTGLRIGLATAKGLCLATGAPVVGIGTLRTLAAGVATVNLAVAPIINAHKGEVYAAAYTREGGKVVELLAPLHAIPSHAGALVRGAVDGRHLLVVGDGLGVYGPSLSDALGAHDAAGPAFDVPRATVLAHEAVLAYEARGADDARTLEPLYVRGSDAKLPNA